MKPFLALAILCSSVQAAEAPSAPSEFRGNKLDPAVVKILPAPEAFEQKFFPATSSIPSNTAIINACLFLCDQVISIPGFLDGHGGLASLVKDLKDFATQVQRGPAPVPPEKLLPTLSTKVASVSISARNISARPNEYPEAVAVARQINNLAEIIRKRLPPLP